MRRALLIVLALPAPLLIRGDLLGTSLLPPEAVIVARSDGRVGQTPSGAHGAEQPTYEESEIAGAKKTSEGFFSTETERRIKKTWRSKWEVVGQCDSTCNGGGPCDDCNDGHSASCLNFVDSPSPHYWEISQDRLDEIINEQKAGLSQTSGVALPATAKAKNDRVIIFGSRNHAQPGTKLVFHGTITTTLTQIYIRKTTETNSLTHSVTTTDAPDGPPTTEVRIENSIKRFACGCKTGKTIHVTMPPPDKPTPRTGTTGTGSGDKPGENPFKPKTREEPQDFKSERGSILVPKNDLLPPGAVYATAVVTPDTQVRVEEPGYALVASADVVDVKRVQRGDSLDARHTPSIAFDSGKALLITTAAAVPILAARCGSQSVIGNGCEPLPLNQGSATVCVVSNREFGSSMFLTDSDQVLPSRVHVTFLNSSGKTIGQMGTWSGLQAGNGYFRVSDEAGKAIAQAPVEGGVLECSPRVYYDKKTYRSGEHGNLIIENQSNYANMKNATCFGGCSSVWTGPVVLNSSSNMQGMPEWVPFGVTRIPFVAVAPLGTDTLRTAVIMPSAIPPMPARDGAVVSDPLLKQSNTAFDLWRSKFSVGGNVHLVQR